MGTEREIKIACKSFHYCVLWLSGPFSFYIDKHGLLLFLCELLSPTAQQYVINTFHEVS